MRKFSKILTLILVLVAILTAFTVVALADGESTKPPIEATYGQTFDSYSEGTILNDSYKARNGLAVLQVQDNGNKYVLTKPNDTEYADTSSSNWHNPQWDVYTTQYGSIVDYPYFSVELDVTTTNGKYGDFACYPRLFGTSNNKSSFVTNNTFKNLGLSTTPYEWNHLSIVVEYKGDGKFTTYRYVNGNQIGDPVDVDLSGTDLFKKDPLKDIKLSSMKLYPYANSTVCIDNLYVTYFPVGYLDGNISDIANYRYNYGKGYEFPYTYTKAWVGDTAYDDLGEAMAAAADGVTVKLTENTKEALIIDKNIILDTNVYDANGNATGSFYTYEYKTSKGLVPTETEAGSGKYAFARSENAVDILWDEACGEDCDCFEEFGGHRLTTTTTMLLGATPEFFGEVPTWEIAADYTQKKLIGWSYENDGTVDELLPISEADVTAGTIKLYPVYENIVYSFAVISKNATEYYVEKDFGALLTSAPSGATIKLVRDVYTEVATVQLKKPLTIDLNGHNLKRCFVYGNVYEATKNGDEFVYDTTTVANTVASGGDIFFQYYANYASLTITSSTGSGTFYNFKMDADTWTYNGETVKRVSKTVAPARITNASESTKSTSYISLTLNGGITVYASQLFYSLYASGTGYSITVDNVKYYKLDSTAFITSRTNYTIDINITNSLIYAPNNGGDFVFLGTTNNSTYGSEHYSKIIIKNCDVIKSGTGWGFNFSNTRYAGTTDVIFDNCRLYDAGVESATTCDPDVVGINGTLCYYTNLEKQESIPVNHPEGWSEEKVSIPVTYYVPSTTFAVTGDDINVPTFDYPATEKQTKNYNRLITKEVDVNWVDANGKVIKTDKLTPGIDAIPTAPVVTYALESDPYRNILAQWVDENGNALASKLGVTTSGVNWQDSYTFRPVKPTENIQYVGGLKDIFFNLSFNSKFCYNLYLPAGDAKLTISEVSDFTGGANKVMIDGNAYYVYTFTPGTTAAADTTNTVIKFTANGADYEQTLRLDALLYADIILASSDVEEEKLAVGNMARFIMEACKYSDVEIDEERINAIIADAGVADYADEYKGDGNIEELESYISTISYVIYNGASAYKFVLTDASYAENIKFTLNGKNVEFTANGAELILDSAKIYDIIDTLTITVGDKSATYSMLDNIEANPNSDLLKALYEFGLAAENYRAYIETIAE